MWGGGVGVGGDPPASAEVVSSYMRGGRQLSSATSNTATYLQNLTCNMWLFVAPENVSRYISARVFKR